MAFQELDFNGRVASQEVDSAFSIDSLPFEIHRSKGEEY